MSLEISSGSIMIYGLLMVYGGGGDMEFGFGVATRGPGAVPDDIVRLGQRGEDLGFEIVTVSDHVIIPRDIGSIYPYSEDGAFAGSDSGECLEQ